MNITHISCRNRELISDKTASALIGMAFFVLAMALGSYIRIPVPGSPVPITLQTFFVLLSGAVLGRKLGFFTCAAYGVLSVPYLLGPTGGYFAGFACASYLTGLLLAEKDASMGRIIASFAFGIAVIYALGVSWLVLAYRVNIIHAITVGALPFIAGDVVKVAFAAIIYKKIEARAKELYSN